MKKQLMIVGIIVILITVGLSGCTNNPLDTERNKFVGTWKVSGSSYSSYTAYTFLSDGTGSFSGLSITWEIKDGKLIITWSVSGATVKPLYYYVFSNNDQTLTLTSVTDSSSITYTKQ